MDVKELQQLLLEKENEIKDLKSCLAINELEISRLQKGNMGTASLRDNLQNEFGRFFPMLTPNQIALMTGQKKRVNWTCEEIARGFTLSFFHKRAYNYTINSLKFPLPAIRTLQKWSENMSVLPGVVLKDSLVVLKALSATLTEGQRQVCSSTSQCSCYI